MIQSASYQTTLNPGGESGSVERSVEVIAEYDVEVFQPDMRVGLPMSEEAAHLMDVAVDGQTIQANWDSTGHTIW